MGLLQIFLLILIVVALALVIFNVPISQKVVNILLLIIAALVVLSGSGVNIALR
jgi:hypothetical protein